MRKYKKYEFCKDIGCPVLLGDYKTDQYCDCGKIDECFWTAKEFHKWLKANGFKIIKD